jgi:O-antigen ligase
MNLYKLSVLSLCFFIITFPLSVTISQSFAVLGSLFFILDSGTKKNLLRKMKYPIFIMGTLLYLSLLISFFKHFNSYENPLREIIKGEFSDIWFCIVFLASGFLARDRENLKLFKISYFISLSLVLTSGIISIFTPFRLASYITNGFKIVEGARAQHYAGDLFGLHTYLPIGLMNTHLTFGGILGLFYPGLLAYFIYKFPERKEYKNLFYSLIIFLFTVLLLYNQSRSIWMGIFFALTIMVMKWRDFLKEFINKKRLFYLFILFMIIFTTGIYFFQKNWLLKRALEDSISDNTTENQRYFIYKNTLDIIYNNPFFGVGAGNFSQIHKEYSNKMAIKNPELYYELSVTPRGHAHNDLLHFFTTGGIFSATLFILFWLLNIKFFLEAEDEQDSILFSGFLVLFPSGFFQCYFLDDEVALPFFVFLGIFCGRVISLSEVQKEKERIIRLLQKRKTKAGLTFQVEALSIRHAIDSLSYWLLEATGTESKEKRKSVFKDTIFILILPLFFCFIYIFNLTSKDINNIYKRKIKSDSREVIIEFRKSLTKKSGYLKKEFYNIPVKIEGCLSHYYNEKLVVRKDPFSINFIIDSSFKNPPKNLYIDVISRDSFDQDKMYKVHTEKVISSHEYLLINGKNTIQMQNDTSILKSDEVLFRDFQIHFTPLYANKDGMDLPFIDFGNICNAQ